MILYNTSREFTASARAGILATLIDARSIIETFRVVGAFWSAVGRTTDVVEQAGACWLRTDHLAL